jgi:integrase/recombinase XerD
MPRGLAAGQVEAILAVIPRARLRDRVLFGLIAQTGLRAGEALAVHVEDLDPTPGDEHLRVVGKGGRPRTVLLDDDRLVALLRRYLTTAGYRSGPLFRAEKNHIGGPLRYASAQARWAQYTATAGVSATLHQLRHTHATALVQGGVSLATIRKMTRARQPADSPALRQRNSPTAPQTPSCGPGDGTTPPEPSRGLPPAQPGGATTGVAAAG